MKAQGLCVRNRISEGVACSEPNHQFRVAVEEHQRQAREALSHAERDFFENYEVMQASELQKVSKIDAKDTWKTVKGG